MNKRYKPIPTFEKNFDTDKCRLSDGKVGSLYMNLLSSLYGLVGQILFPI